MNQPIKFKFLLVAAAMFALPVANAADLSRTDYRVAKTQIDDDYKVEKIACTALMSNARDVCIEEAKGREKNARAELEYRYTGSMHDMDKIAVVKAEAAYAVAKEKCDDFAGNDKDVCVKAARATEVGARADAKTAVQIREAKLDNTDKKRDADFNVAVERCDALAGAAKTSCVVEAKSRFYKM